MTRTSKRLTFTFSTCMMMLMVIKPISASSDHLSIKFSKKNQLRTSMFWIRLKPKLILGASLKPVGVDNPDGKRPRAQSRNDNLSAASKSFSSVELPYAAVGKLFFTTDGDKISTCSAAFAGGPKLIVTAAHCVMDKTGSWNSNFLFIRSYGSAKQDVYAIQCIAVPDEWGALTDDEALRYDYAFLRTNRISKAGSLDVTRDYPPDTLMLVGYSDNYFNGRKLLRLDVQAFVTESGQIGSTNNPLSTGSSGTPWIDFSTVFTVTSHYRSGDRDIVWGPQLTDDSMKLIRYTRNGCGIPQNN